MLLPGVIVNVGHSRCSVVPIYEGYALPHAVQCLEIGGQDVTDYLQKISTERGFSFTTTAERDILEGVMLGCACRVGVENGGVK